MIQAENLLTEFESFPILFDVMTTIRTTTFPPDLVTYLPGLIYSFAFIVLAIKSPIVGYVTQPTDKRRNITIGIILYVIFVSAFGMFSYHHSDANSFFSMISSFYSEGKMYSNPAPSYFPLVYLLMAIFLYPIRVIGLTIGPNSYSLFLINCLFALSLVLLVYYGYSGSVQKTQLKTWVLFVLLNPLTLIGVYIWGQSDALVALGVGIAIIAATRNSWVLFGAGAAFGASLKIYPGLMLLPPLLRQSGARKDILKGILPIALINILLLLFDYKNAIGAFLNPNYSFGIRGGRSGITESNPAWMIGYFTSIPAEQLASIIFVVSVIIMLIWALFGIFKIDSLRIIVVLFPILLTYPTLYTYRWLPIIVGISWLGYTQSGLYRLKVYAQGASLIGAYYLLIQILLGSLSATPTFFQYVGIYLPNKPLLTTGATFPVLSIIFVGIANWILFIWAFYPIALESVGLNIN